MDRQSAQIARDPALESLRKAADPVVLLHSGRRHPRWATRSLLARPRAWFRYTHHSERGTGNSELTFPAGVGRWAFRAPSWTHRLWPDLRELLHNPTFPGRWFGYFSYDLCRLIEPTKLAPRAGGWPLVELAWCPEVEEVPAVSRDESGIVDPRFQVSDLRSNFTRPAYEAAIRRVLDYISAGDVFQVNLAQRFTTHYRGDPRALYERLATTSPAWYGAYLELPERRAILSTSPELFLRLQDRRIITRPIKGTLAATSDAVRLRASGKDTAELNMIVDLMRNDLGRVCSYGSVRVTEPRSIETHPTVHHGVATVEGDLHESMDVVDLLRATLPGGSVTGAPKVRAMQVIDELEPDPRGPYCGAIGYVSKDELQLSVAIRTMLLTPNSERGTRNDASRLGVAGPSFRVDFSAGGGIVADSEPGAEYEETLAKAAAMVAALGAR